MKTARKLVGIEYFRVAAAFLVVAIHCSPLLTYSETADFIFTRVLARAAVPFFFMVTGYFVIGKPEKTRNFLKKTGVIYLASILLYLPLNLYAGNFKGLTPGAALTQLLLEGTFYHLWYLPAALLGVLATSLLASSRAGLGIAGALYLLGLLGDSYWGLVSGVPVVSDVYNVIFSVAGYTRNGLFFAPLFLLLGGPAKHQHDAGKHVLRQTQQLPLLFAVFHHVPNIAGADSQALRRRHRVAFAPQERPQGFHDAPVVLHQQNRRHKGSSFLNDCGYYIRFSPWPQGAPGP